MRAGIFIFVDRANKVAAIVRRWSAGETEDVRDRYLFGDAIHFRCHSAAAECACDLRHGDAYEKATYRLRYVLRASVRPP